MDPTALPGNPVGGRAAVCGDVETVLARASALVRSAREAPLAALLSDKHIALVSEAPDGADAQALRCAAVELGARVAHVRPGLSDSSPAVEVAETAHMLGRLYDAIDIEGQSTALVDKVRLAAGVPVFHGIASPEHPTAQLASSLEGVASVADARRFVIQALLLTAMS